MSKFFWLLSIITIPLLMLRYYRLEDIPLTNLFIFLSAFFNISSILKDKIGSIEKSIYLLFSFFIIIAFLDLTRTLTEPVNFFFEIKLIILLLSLKLYAYFIHKYGIDYFLKFLTLSSSMVLILLLLRSLFIYNAPYFVVDPEQITESGKNQVAFYLALIVPCIWWYLKILKSRFWEVIVFICLFIHLLAVLYVQSKGLLISLLGGLIITVVFYSKFKFKLSDLIKYGFILTIPFYFIITSSLIDLADFIGEVSNLYSGNISNSNSASERLTLVNYSLNFFYDNPIFGIGTNNFAKETALATHNNYLQILAENGILGFIIFLFFFIRVLILIRRLKFQDKNYLLVVNINWALLTYLFLINGFFNAVTIVVLAIIIYYEKNVSHPRF